MPEQFGDKSHEATPHRRQQAREKGEVAKSHDLSSAAVLLAALGAIGMLGQAVVEFLGTYTARQLGGDPWLHIDGAWITSHWSDTAAGLARVLLPMMGAMLAAAVVASLVQTGLLFLPHRVVPDASRINPWRGVARIFSLAGVARLVFGLFKVVVVLAVAAVSLYQRRDELLVLPELSTLQVAVQLLDILFWTAVKIALALLVLALLEYGFQRWKHEQDLRMTTQEMKEELKTLQGDPQIVARRRQVQRQLVLRRLSTLVPKADFVVTNPTELAVAVQYDPTKMNAPIVAAKGAGVLAQQIRRLAAQHGVPIIERKPLAQFLYKHVEVGHPIPQSQYAAVAEILRYVYELKGKPLPGGNPEAA
jgi:flagellar biosynthetic protein FlhB